MQHENPQVQELLELKAQGKYDYQLKTYLKNKVMMMGKLSSLCRWQMVFICKKKPKSLESSGVY